MACLLQPEIMSYQELSNWLSKAGIMVENNESRFNLIQKYYAHVLPLPQRTHRPNRTGIELTISQRKRNIRPHLEPHNLLLEEANKRTSSSNLPIRTSGLVNDPGGTAEIGKGTGKVPPISCINMEKKKIKLSTPGTTAVVPKPTQPIQSNNLGKVLANNSCQVSKSATKDILKEKSSLKRSIDKDCHSGEESKKKFKKITWP